MDALVERDAAEQVTHRRIGTVVDREGALPSLVVELRVLRDVPHVRVLGVILEVGGRQGVLLVDTLMGQEDVVVRPVHAPRGVPRWVNGATILSDGLPALVLDPTALV